MVARVVIEGSMSKLLGLILLVAGCVMPFFWWQAREAALAIAGGNSALATGSQSVWWLTVGALSAVGCLAVSLRVAREHFVRIPT